MRCAEFESRLNGVLDRRLWLDADPPLAEHAQTCGECRALAACYEAVVAGLSQARLPQPSSELTSRVLADVAPRPASPRPDEAAGGVLRRISPVAPGRRRLARSISSRGVIAVAAMAATVLVAVVMRWGQLDPARQPRRNQEPLAARQAPGDRVSAGTPGQPALTQATPSHAPNKTPRNKRSPYQGLAAETSQTVAVAMQLLPGVGVSAIDDGDAAAAEPASDWVHGVADGLKPVTEPTAGAVNSFLELLATGDGGSRS